LVWEAPGHWCVVRAPRWLCCAVEVEKLYSRSTLRDTWHRVTGRVKAMLLVHGRDHSLPFIRVVSYIR
jgi:hypothetical protein